MATAFGVRSRVAFQAAGAVLISWVCGTLLASSTSVKYLEVALACVIGFATPMNHLGDTCRNGFTWITSAFVLAPLGFGCCYLCFLLGGLRWNHWIVAIGLSCTAFLAILWAFAAQQLSAPRAQLAGNSATVVIALIPLLVVNTGVTQQKQVLLGAAGLLIALFVGAVIPLVLSHLPYIGALSARRQVPACAAAKLTALADLCEATAIYQLPTPAALQRHRECRLRLLAATVDLQAAVQSASMELTEPDLFPEASMLGDFKSKSEDCRRSLQMKSTMLAAGFSQVTWDLFFKGAQGELLRSAAVSAAHALRSSASRLRHLAGDEVPEVPSASWLGSGSSHASAKDCQEAAQRCRSAWENFWEAQLTAASQPQWRERVEESMLRSMPEFEKLPGVPLDLFLSGAHYFKTEGSPEGAQVAAFDEACRHCASLLGVRGACEAAASLAEMAQHAQQDWRWRLPFAGSFTGCRHWLRVPFKPQAWKTGWNKGAKFGGRMAIAILIAEIIYVNVKPHLPEDEDGLWTLITVTMAVTPVAGNSIFRGLLRLFGTFLGALLAVGTVALGGSAYTQAPSVFIMAFFNKYFEQELQFAGMVNFTTYVIVLNTLADRNDPEISDQQEVLRLATRRMLDVMIGVCLAMFANVFFFPERAVDELRARELLSFQRTAEAIRTSSVVLAGLAARAPEPEDSWDDLRADLFASAEAMNFAGDGRPGVMDLLSDAYFESQWRVAGGARVLGGALWVPCGGKSLPGHRCLEAVIGISRMLRITYMMVSLCEPGFEQGAERPLANDPMVLQALGYQGAAIGDELDRVLNLMKPRFEASGCEQHKGTPGELNETLERLEERLELLFRGAAASRARSGGLTLTAGHCGGARSAAVIKMLHGAVEAFIQACRQL
ncbi:unnamed protein product, partial [Durusdinium trenchii]